MNGDEESNAFGIHACSWKEILRVEMTDRMIEEMCVGTSCCSKGC